MSFQINLQKTNKDSQTKDRLIVRRYVYDSDTKRSKAGKVIFSANINKLPDELPPIKIKAFDVTESEQEQYIDTVRKLKVKMHENKLSIELRSTNENIIDLTRYLEERSDGVTVEEIEAIENAMLELRKQLTRHKRNATHRVKQDMDQTDWLED